MKSTGLITALIFMALVSTAAPVTVTITDKVLVKDTERLGVHFSGDNFYDSVILKKRVAENFEGTVERLHAMGPWSQPDPNGMFVWGPDLDRHNGNDYWVGSTVHILAGTNQWETRTLKAVEVRDNPDESNVKKRPRAAILLFDKPVHWTGEKYTSGVLLEKTDLKKGQHPWLVEKRKTVDGENVKYLDVDSQYASDNTEIVTGDVHKDAFGVAALKLDGTKNESYVKFRVQFYKAAPYDGDWTFTLWAKSLSGSGTLKVKPSVPGTSVELPLTGEWRMFTDQLTLEKPEGDNNAIFMLEVHANGCAALIDDVEAWKDGDGTNPTPFRDELVQVFQDLNPGSVRYLRNQKNSYLNSVMPRIKTYSRQGAAKRRDDFGTHEFYQFCEYVGADPWATLPGTFLIDEIDPLMEYHGAPANKGLGKLRAELGHPEPWTKVFDKIHIQFGNEAITFSGTGYWGAEYWESMVQRAKASPYYDPDVFVFHINEQGCGTRGMELHPSFDRFTINGYHIFAIYDDQTKAAGDLEGFYDWVFASAWHMWMHPEHNKMHHALEGAKQRGVEASIYEGGNYHTTFCDPDAVDMDRINRMCVGKAGGMSAAHTMLILLKNWGARTQQSFNLSQFNFSPGGGFGNLPERVRLWGGVLRIGDPPNRRYRPRFLALQMANEVCGGDLLETVHGGDDLAFEVSNRFGAGYGPSKSPKEMTVSGIPRIHSYAFREGDRRGLILVSNDPRKARTIELQFDGKVKNGEASMWLLDSPDLEDTNEHDWTADGPKVKIVESIVKKFQSGYTLELPKATMLVLEWEEK